MGSGRSISTARVIPSPHGMLRRAPFLLLLALVAACAGGGAFEGGVLRKGELAVQLGPVPAAWHAVAIAGADLAWRDAARDGSALFDVRCEGRDRDAPLGVLTEHLIMGTTERDFTTQDVVAFDHRVPLQYDIYVMKKDGCVYDLVYVAPPQRFPAGAEDFERFARGVHAASAER